MLYVNLSELKLILFMFIYNITTNVDESIHLEWLNWMKDTHIPDILATGNFHKALISEVMVKEELGGITYSIQFTCDSKEKLEKYFLKDDQKMQNKVRKLFENKFGTFTTVMKIVKELEI